MSGFEELEGQLLAAIERKGSRRSPRSAVLVVAVSSSLVAALAVFAIVALGHRTPPAPRPAAHVRPPVAPSGRELSYFNAAMHATFRAHPACQVGPWGHPQGATLNQGKPSGALLSVLGVLRRPATAADRLPAELYRDGHLLIARSATGVYVRYIRRARIVNGVSYYIIPAASFGWPAPSARTLNRCYAEEMRALRRQVSQASPAVRAQTLEFGAKQFARRTRAGAAVHEGVWDFTWGRGEGEGSGGISAQMLEQHGEEASAGPVLHGIVPDGVASVTLEYPARGGVRTVRTADVVNNVFVSPMPSNGGVFPSEMIWRAANRHVIRVVTNP